MQDVWRRVKARLLPQPRGAADAPQQAKGECMKLHTMRVKAGAALLDVIRPGWAAEIQPDLLDLSNCSKCVIGQLFGDFWEGAEKIFAIANEGRDAADTYAAATARNGRLGAIAARGGFYESGDVEPRFFGKRLKTEYTQLTEAWRREVARRVKAVA